MIILDASVLIAHFDGDDAHNERAKTLLEQFGDDGLAANQLTLAEVLVRPARVGRLDLAQSALDELGVTQVLMGNDAPGRLASLRASTNLKMPDCCTLYAAEQTGSALATFDDRLASAAKVRGVTVLD